MAFIITDDCVKCGECAQQCPTEAIHEEEYKYVIDADQCLGCGSCAIVCPTRAAQPNF